MKREHETAQWSMTVTIYHGKGFSHRASLWVVSRQYDPIEVGSWPWTGVGVDSELLLDMEAGVCGVLSDHMVSRYGEQLTISAFVPRHKRAGL